jgi:dsDNA-binding SOS-regulon protein
LRRLLEKRFSISIVDPSEEAADKLRIYLARNPEILAKIKKTSSVKFI